MEQKSQGTTITDSIKTLFYFLIDPISHFIRYMEKKGAGIRENYCYKYSDCVEDEKARINLIDRAKIYIFFTTLGLVGMSMLGIFIAYFISG